LIAAGGEPEAGSFPGAELCMNSNDVFDLETLPESISVIGGGYIGIELAQILHALGVKTTLIVRSIPLRFVDREVVDTLVHSMK
jgi:glutathione reductase (NADPH)